MESTINEINEFVYTRNSANIAYYREKDGPLYASVCENALDFTERPVRLKSVSDYSVTVYRNGEGIVKEFSYTPIPRRVGGVPINTGGNLDSLVVTNLIRREMGDAPTPRTPERKS